MTSSYIQPNNLASRHQWFNGLMRFRLLDLSRGIAAIMVIAYHAAKGQIQLFTGFYIAVDFFFVLSGFVLANQLVRGDKPFKQSYRDFVAHRFVRIWSTLIPLMTALLLVWAVPLIIHALQGGGWSNGTTSRNLGNFVAATLLLHIFFSSALVWDNPLWSLSAEWFANLLVPPFIRKHRQKALVLLALAGVAIFIIGMSRDGTWSFFTDNRLIKWTTNTGRGPILGMEAFGRCLAGFSVGVLAADLFKRGTSKFSARHLTFASVFSVIIVLLANTAILRVAAIPLASLPFAYLIYHLALLEQRINLQKLIAKFSDLMGRCSYGIYIWHSPIVIVLRKFLDTTDIGKYEKISLLFLGGATISLTIAYISSVYLEPKIRVTLKSLVR